MKAFADDSILIFNNVENILGKGKIAHHKQFLVLPQCFHPFPILEKLTHGTEWQWVKLLLVQNRFC